MRMFVDLGHSRIKWLARDGTAEPIGGVANLEDPGSLEEQWRGLASPVQVTVASVAPPEKEAVVRDTADHLWGAPVQWLDTPSSGWGVKTAYHESRQLGIDRFAALVAGHAEYPHGAIIWDVGTAVTIDVLLAGEHRGGIILPGLHWQQRTLQESVGLAPGTVAPARQEGWLGCTTAEGIERGTAYALVGACSMVQSANPAFAGLPVLMTGGDAERLASLTPGTWIHRPQLVLDGVEIMARQNQDGQT